MEQEVRQVCNEIVSVGYKPFSIKDFCETMEAYDVSVVADVRMKPYSWNKEYRRESLRASLEFHKIGYRHIPMWGNVNYKGEMGDDVIISNQDYGNKTMDRLRVESGKVAVLCSCESHDDCHRSDVLAEYRLSTEYPFIIVHAKLPQPDDGLKQLDLFGGM